MTEALTLARRASRTQTGLFSLFAVLLAGVSAIPQYQRSLLPGGFDAAMAVSGGRPSGAAGGAPRFDVIRIALGAPRSPVRGPLRGGSRLIPLGPQGAVPGSVVAPALTLPGSTGSVSDPTGPRFALAGTTPGVASDFGIPSPFRALLGGGGLTGALAGSGGGIGGGGGGIGAAPSPSPTPAPSPTPSASPTPTPTPAPSASPTPTPAPSASPTPTPAPSPSATLTPSPTPGTSPTPSPTPSSSASPSPTPTATSAPSPSPTASGSPTPTPSAGPTPTPTPLPTMTPDPLPTGGPPVVIPPLSGVPEPASWLLFTLGVGLAGGALRRRPRSRKAGAERTTPG